MAKLLEAKHELYATDVVHQQLGTNWM